MTALTLIASVRAPVVMPAPRARPVRSPPGRRPPTLRPDSTDGAGVTTGSAGADTPAPAGVSDAEWDEIVTAAKEEGKVTIYSSQGLDVLNDLAAEFKDKYGITFEVVRGIDSELIPKVEAENQTGKGIADVFAFASAAVGSGQRGQGVVRRTGRPGVRRPGLRQGVNVSADGTYFMSTAAVLRLRLEHRPLLARAEGLRRPARSRRWPAARSA